MKKDDIAAAMRRAQVDTVCQLFFTYPWRDGEDVQMLARWIDAQGHDEICPTTFRADLAEAIKKRAEDFDPERRDALARAADDYLTPSPGKADHQPADEETIPRPIEWMEG